MSDQHADRPALEVRGLKVEIPTADGLLKPVRGVDLTVRRGETHAIVGESGCGKSLTSLALLGLQPRQARVSVDVMDLDGASLKGLTDRQWRTVRGARMAMIFQDPMTSLDPNYRIGNQMTEMLRQHQRVSHKAALEKAGSLLSKVGIPNPRERLNQYPHQLSGGLRQRVMIAMALLCEPEIIIADEPTTALDVTVQLQILELLRRVMAETRVGLILITHDLGVVASIADTTSVMYGGKIVETGPTRALLAAPRHPYTEGLMRATPIPGKTGRGEMLGSIPGIVPRQLGDLARCGFMERCPYAAAVCAQPVLLRPESDGRSIRCTMTDHVPHDGSVWTRLAGEVA